MKDMKTRELVLIGVGGIIGAGFFLGSGLPIRLAGPAVLISFVIGALVTAQVTGAVTSMVANHREVTSFQAFSERYLGPYVGYLQGWVYYVSSVLAIASESIAMSIFIRFWLPGLPTYVSAFVFAALVLVLNAFGVRNFERVESVMSVVKIAALIGFIVVALAGVLTFLPGIVHPAHTADGFAKAPNAWHVFAPNGVSGVFQSMLIVIFSFSGIGVFATAATRIHNPKRLDRGALTTVLVLTLLYVVSIGLVLIVTPWRTVSTSQSPFVMTLTRLHARPMADIMNGAVLVAAFSVMAGAAYSATQILHSLATAGHAPKWLRSNPSGRDIIGIGVTGLGVLIALLLSFVLPANVYNFLISTSSYFTFLNWTIIMSSYLSWGRRRGGATVFHSILSRGAPVTIWITMALILAMTGYSLLQRDQRTGFVAAVAVVVVLSVGYLVLNRMHPNHRETTQPTLPGTRRSVMRRRQY